MTDPSLPRRRFLAATVTMDGAALVNVPVARADATDSGKLGVTANGWPVLAIAPIFDIEGSDLTVALAPGAASGRPMTAQASRIRSTGCVLINGHMVERSAYRR